MAERRKSHNGWTPVSLNFMLALKSCCDIRARRYEAASSWYHGAHLCIAIPTIILTALVGSSSFTSLFAEQSATSTTSRDLQIATAVITLLTSAGVAVQTAMDFRGKSVKCLKLTVR